MHGLIQLQVALRCVTCVAANAAAQLLAGNQLEQARRQPSGKLALQRRSSSSIVRCGSCLRSRFSAAAAALPFVPKLGGPTSRKARWGSCLRAAL